MITVDWNPLITVIITAIGVGITTFVPLFVKLVMEAISARLILVKQFTDRNQALAHDVVIWVQDNLKLASNDTKLQAAIAKFEASIPLPEGTVIDLLEMAISAAKFEAADNWAKLGTPKTVPAPVLPTQVEVTMVPALPEVPVVPEVPVETPLENPEI